MNEPFIVCKPVYPIQYDKPQQYPQGYIPCVPERFNIKQMKCPKCGDFDLVIALAANGFGSWKCNRCNSSGCYPPSESDK